MQFSLIFFLSSNQVSTFRPLGEPLFNIATENCRPDHNRTLWISPSESLRQASDFDQSGRSRWQNHHFRTYITFPVECLIFQRIATHLNDSLFYLIDIVNNRARNSGAIRWKTAEKWRTRTKGPKRTGPEPGGLGKPRVGCGFVASYLIWLPWIAAAALNYPAVATKVRKNKTFSFYILRERFTTF